MRSLWVGIELQRGLLIVVLEGELTIATSPDLLEKFRGALASVTRGVVVDARRLTFMDSSGLGALIALQREMRKAGLPVTYAGFGGAPKKVLDMTHMGLVMNLHDSVDAARAAIK